MLVAVFYPPVKRKMRPTPRDLNENWRQISLIIESGILTNNKYKSWFSFTILSRPWLHRYQFNLFFHVEWSVSNVRNSITLHITEWCRATRNVHQYLNDFSIYFSSREKYATFLTFPSCGKKLLWQWKYEFYIFHVKLAQ